MGNSTADRYQEPSMQLEDWEISLIAMICCQSHVPDFSFRPVAVIQMIRKFS